MRTAKSSRKSGRAIPPPPGQSPAVVRLDFARCVSPNRPLPGNRSTRPPPLQPRAVCPRGRGHDAASWPGRAEGASCRAICPSASFTVRAMRAARSEWVTVMRVRFSSAFSSTSSWPSLSAVASSRAPVGSSASRSCGSLIRARTTAARWRSPPESWPGRWARRSPRPTRSSRRRARSSSSAVANVRERGHAVFHHGALRQEMMALKDETHLAIAQGGKLGVVQTAKFATVKGSVPPVG